jgi:hypothetical protein
MKSVLFVATNLFVISVMSSVSAFAAASTSSRSVASADTFDSRSLSTSNAVMQSAMIAPLNYICRSTEHQLVSMEARMASDGSVSANILVVFNGDIVVKAEDVKYVASASAGVVSSETSVGPTAATNAIAGGKVFSVKQRWDYASIEAFLPDTLDLSGEEFVTNFQMPKILEEGQHGGIPVIEKMKCAKVVPQ